MRGRNEMLLYTGAPHIHPYVYGNSSSNTAFRSLEILRFELLNDWKEWLCLEGFPSLKELYMRYCPKLKRALPQHLPLQKLVISYCQELKASIPKAANISVLELEGCENIWLNESPSRFRSAFLCGTRVIESSLEQILFNNAFLEELCVRDFNGANLECYSSDLRSCNSLRSLSMTGWRSSSLPFALHLFTKLHSLNLSDCLLLESFPGGGLPLSLIYLQIDNCPKLIASREEWGLFKLCSLKRFSVSDDFENLECFPEESLLPPTLNSLEFKRCSKLRLINYRGLIHLKSLKSLNIERCPCLERLPEEGLSNSLSTLHIAFCSLLTKPYRKQKGERWHKIRHIPSVTIY